MTTTYRGAPARAAKPPGPGGAAAHEPSEPVKPREVELSAASDEEPHFEEWAADVFAACAGARASPDGASCSSLQARMESITTFTDPELRRGIPLARVLTRGGLLLSSRSGTAETFNMSRPSPRLDVFLSHNWSTGRAEKFLTLAYHFNFPVAFLAGLLGTLAVAGLLLSGQLPVMTLPTASEHDPLRSVVAVMLWASCISAVLSVVALLFGHELCRVGLNSRGVAALVFLDKACIHQTDPVIQRRGIESLSAYLAASSEMVIVYTDTYLSRLWTVYEFASMIVMRPGARIRVIPTSLVLIVSLQFAMLLVWYLAWTVALRFMMSMDGAHDVVVLCLLILLLAEGLWLAWTLRWWARERARMETKARSFQIREAACAVESDRKLVYGNVALLMRNFGFVPTDAMEDVALDAFDFLARRLMPAYLHASWGLAGVPWRSAFIFVPTGLGFGFDTQAPHIFEASTSMFVTRVVCFILVHMAYFPLSMALVSWLAYRWLHLRGAAECAFVCALWLVAALCNLPGLLIEKWLRPDVWERAIGVIPGDVPIMVGAVAFTCLGIVPLPFLYRDIRVPPSVHASAKADCQELFGVGYDLGHNLLGRPAL